MLRGGLSGSKSTENIGNLVKVNVHCFYFWHWVLREMVLNNQRKTAGICLKMLFQSVNTDLTWVPVQRTLTELCTNYHYLAFPVGCLKY